MDSPQPPNERPKTPLELERERLKALYKEDFRKRKAFLDDLERQRRLNPVEKALGRMLEMSDDTDEWIARLQGKTAELEARTEMAMEERGVNAPSATPTPLAAPPQSAAAPQPEPTPELPTDLKPKKRTLGDLGEWTAE
jgi:hypothetical protein